MKINFIDLSSSITASYQGEFNSDVINSIDGNRTIFPFTVLNNKKNIMDNRQFIEDLRALLNSRFNNDIELFARTVGIPANLIHDFLNGVSGPPHGIIDQVEKQTKGGDYFQFGNKVEVYNSGDGYEQSYADILRDDKDEYTKYLKLENSDLHKLVKEKDKLIAALQETIELLKNK